MAQILWPVFFGPKLKPHPAKLTPGILCDPGGLSDLQLRCCLYTTTVDGIQGIMILSPSNSVDILVRDDPLMYDVGTYPNYSVDFGGISDVRLLHCLALLQQ